MSFNMDHYLSSHETMLFNRDMAFSLHAASQEAPHTNFSDGIFKAPVNSPTRMRFYRQKEICHWIERSLTVPSAQQGVDIEFEIEGQRD
jgi:hypothetical protein